MQKRIAVISYHTCPISDEGAEVGGLNVYVLELSKQLARKGYSIDIFTRLQSPKSPKIVQVEKNLRVIHLKAGLTKYMPPKKMIGDIPEFCESVRKFIESENITYDVLSCHYYLSGMVGIKLKKIYKIPMLMTFHTLALLKNLVARSNEEKETLFRIETEQELVAQSDAVIAT
ncbi:MAG TPA: glycosyltransferase, partial [Candidatus Saccharimonadales bacterium]|nr:glycosyltransferase [Candidatus Saccharimonadales bacterium]